MFLLLFCVGLINDELNLSLKVLDVDFLEVDDSEGLAVLKVRGFHDVKYLDPVAVAERLLF